MDACEATRIVFSRIQSLDPENASKIMGLLLIQDHGEKEMIRLAFGPEALVHSVVLKARNDLGLSSNTPSTPSTPSSPSPFSNPISISRQNSSNSSSRFVNAGTLNHNFPHSLTLPTPSASSPSSWAPSVFSDLQTQDDLMSSNSTSINGIGSDLIDEFQLHDQLSFLNDSSPTLNPKNPDLYYAQLDSATNPSGNSDSMLFPSYWGASMNGNPHRRSFSVTDVCLGSDDAAGFGWKPCLYFARGYCKNGTSCRFLHSGFPDSAAISAAGETPAIVGSPSNLDVVEHCQEILRSKTSQQQRLAAASQLMASSSFPYNKCMNFLLQQQQNDTQRAAAALMMGEDVHKFGRSRLERSEFPSPTGGGMVNPPIPPHRPESTITPPLSLESVNSSSTTCSVPVPNKHIPVCPTGPARADEPNTPPPSPRSLSRVQQTSILYPTDAFNKLENGSLSIFEIDARQVAEALDFASRQPLPDPSLVFPWLHGLHPQNHVQQAFFAARRRALRRPPSCIRGVIVVKANSALTCSRLKGAVAPDEILQSGDGPDFVEADPREGFSVRNFQIQTAKVARTSDLIVYGQDLAETHMIAWRIATAQHRWREKQKAQVSGLPEYHTFVCTSPFSDFEENHPEIVAIDSSECLTENVIDFFHQERQEMLYMTEASEISHNVFLGPTPGPQTAEEQQYNILIECSDMGRLNPLALQLIAESPDETGKQHMLDFPSSGSVLPPTWSHSEADSILETCKWIYHLAHGSYPQTDDEVRDTDAEGDSPMPPTPQLTFQVRPRKILIHCPDGYTESTMLGIAYFSYSTGRPVPDAWLNLHTEKKRNFFAYPTDVALLSAITPRLLRESPACTGMSLTEITTLTQGEPSWWPGLDGSFPSRILDYMYLGNLGHANNPELLRALGITQILSVGETAMWRDGYTDEWGEENVCVVEGVQDNGIDPLTEEFSRCLEFIDRGRRKDTATLVHCRVGVSRSATICIAEVMRAMSMSFPHAYCFVRARRLNVIIQPHLRFAYELLRWEETLQQDGDEGAPTKRELEWGEIAREIALMNSPYSR